MDKSYDEINVSSPQAKEEMLLYQKSIFDYDKAPLSVPQPSKAPVKNQRCYRFIDLFSGMGGIRIGLEQAIKHFGYDCRCVFSSEIKPHAIEAHNQNFPGEVVYGDITAIASSDIPDFDILCAGFPCQAFSYAGKRLGFADTRGTLFFDVERILKEKKPQGFILENVEGLVNHDKGKTFQTITSRLKALGYKVSYKVLNAKDFGIPQDRKRIYIVGSMRQAPRLDEFETKNKPLDEVLEHGLPVSETDFTRLLLSNYKVGDLAGKSIKDKRGGTDNIHSWDIGIKGVVSQKEKQLLNAILTERRKKKWAEKYGIAWMDGMPLTEDFIREFYDDEHLHEMLLDLTKKGYLVFEHPKKIVDKPFPHREQDTSLPKGYNIRGR